VTAGTTWRRSQRAAVVDRGDGLLLVGREGSVRKLEGDSADLGRAVLAALSAPRSEDAIVAHLARLAGPIEDRTVIRQLLALLADAGVIASGSPAVVRGVPANILVGISGAIGAIHAPALVLALQRRGHTVEVALTPTAMRFVGADALTAITQRELHTSMWPPAPHLPVPHIALAQWADLVVIYPASATTIARIASGDCSELVAATAIATRAPVLIVPSMNVDMLEAPAIQRNLDLLRADGHTIVHGVPSQEAADAPAARTTLVGAAPAPAEVAATVDALRSAGALPRRGSAPLTPRDWDAAYRTLSPGLPDTCDADLAAALAAHAPPPRTLLDLGCGLGQTARHAAAAGHRVVATDLSEVALALARARSSEYRDIVWLRDDACASALTGPFDVIVDRAVLHALARDRAHAYAATVTRLAAPNGVLILKCHRDTGATTGWTAAALAALLPAFELVVEQAAELPGAKDPAPVPAILAVFRRR
jgi:SAM-dependent methyltransferase/3-polyprenyl-4-hydroxybenzoate decarboxylase